MKRSGIKRIIYLLFFRSWLFRFLVNYFPRIAHEIRWNYDFDSPINWNNPQTLNEKIQWLELNTDTSLWTKYADKYEVREHLIDLGLGNNQTKLYGVWEKVADIDYNKLPDSFVIKCTHDYRSTYIVRDKKTTNLEELNKKLDKHMHRVFGYSSCEPHYTRIKPRIMAEELLNVDEQTGSIIDYKFCCIDSNIEYCMVCYDRPASDERGTAVKDIYSVIPWKPNPMVMTDVHRKHSYIKHIQEPSNLSEMINIVKLLSKGFPLLYVDLYNIKGRIVFGEMTFSREAGRIDYLTDEYQHEVGSKIKLPRKE